MSLRKFMHKKNIYREEPNFKKLAILYPEFREIAIADLAGKIRINFKDERSLQILTKTLLKHDFNLNVMIPPNKLVPALSLRLNYVLWIEDLLKHSKVTDMTKVTGVDIGTGAICIYPLLLCKMYQCKIIGTEIDPDSVEYAEKNIKNNNFEDFIKVVLVKKQTVLSELLEKDKECYSFVMCNPPFFKTDEGLGRKSKLNPPRNAPTGNNNELEVQGGEQEFILRFIKESLEYKNRIKIYTTMFGQKSTLSFLRDELNRNGITNVNWTEFCQGYTKRWGIAWSFTDKEQFDVTTAPVIRTRTEVLKSKDKSMNIVFPPKNGLSNIEEVTNVLKNCFSELKIRMKSIEIEDQFQPCWACQLTSYENTWTHSRRKRRMAMKLNLLTKKSRLENSSLDKKIEESKDNLITDSNLKEEIVASNNHPLLICSVLVSEISQDNEDSDDEIIDGKLIRICLVFESGHGGKLTLETLRQYLVNKLNVREYFCKQKSKKVNKKKKSEK